jgi:hypothetical protein
LWNIPWITTGIESDYTFNITFSFPVRSILWVDRDSVVDSFISFIILALLSENLRYGEPDPIVFWIDIDGQAKGLDG